MKRILGVALASAATVVVVDLSLRTTLSRFLWPVVVSPADGAIATPPVLVRWDGHEPMVAVLKRRGRTHDLGIRHSPFEIDADSFPSPGEYAVEIRSPRFGRWIRADRRFFVGTPDEEEEETAEPPAPPEAPEDPLGEIRERASRLEHERDRILAERDFLRQQIAKLQDEKRDLADTIEELEDAQAETDGRLGAVESQQAELLQEHLTALRENQLLRARLESIPACTTWGYLSIPRMAEPVRRVVVSDARGRVFRSERACVLARRGDPTAASACICVGVVGG